MKIIILGAGPRAADIADLMKDTSEYDVIGFVVDQPPFVEGEKLFGKPIYWIDALESLRNNCKAICGVSHMKKIKLIMKAQEYGIDFLNFIHPSSRILESSIFGNGVVINSSVQIAVNSKVGDFVYFNRGTTIGHDVEIGNYSVISPGVNIGGFTKVGSRTFIGIGATIRDRITIGNGCVIGAGSVIISNIKDHEKAVGFPARVIERNIEEY
jgi:sugar O-acyltransferase (sialic acid O-acetyltransferase NeuD family)